MPYLFLSQKSSSCTNLQEFLMPANIIKFLQWTYQFWQDLFKMLNVNLWSAFSLQRTTIKGGPDNKSNGMWNLILTFAWLDDLYAASVCEEVDWATVNYSYWLKI